MQYSIINYSHHAVHYILMSYLFYNWRFVIVQVKEGKGQTRETCMGMCVSMCVLGGREGVGEQG